MNFRTFLISIIILVSAAKISAKEYKGAEYRTKTAYVYGRFETSYIPANREGVISSFFTYHEFTSQTGWNEIDIEFVGRYNDHIQFNTITPGQKFHIRNQHLSFNPFEDFHIYAFEWTPDYIAWFIDGEEVYRQTGGFVSTLIYPQKIMMNIWNPIYTNWVGYWDDAYLPAHAIYDWVSYSSFTPGNGNSGTDNNFTFEWKDEFDSFDPDRWQKAAHTFAGNQCDFISENVNFENGKMILSLTDENNLGLVDINPPQLMWARENYDKSVTIMFSEELDASSAETTANYIIPGVTITGAVLNSDLKSVRLSTLNYDMNVTYNIIAMNIEDDSPAPNKMSLKAVKIIKILPLEFPLKVNVGGNSFSNYLGDQEWSENTEYGYQMGDVKKWPANIIVSGTSDHTVFQEERKGLTKYLFRVPNGEYKITMMFAENDNNSAGQRVFDILAEGKIVRDNLDVFNEAGKSSLLMVETTAAIFDETIDLFFSDEIDSAFINAVMIEQLTTSAGSLLEYDKPMEFNLYQNYPNPFNGYTTIKFLSNINSGHRLEVFDILGRKILEKKLDTNSQKNEFTLEAGTEFKNVNSGVYIYKLSADKIFDTKKMIYLK